MICLTLQYFGNTIIKYFDINQITLHTELTEENTNQNVITIHRKETNKRSYIMSIPPLHQTDKVLWGNIHPLHVNKGNNHILRFSSKIIQSSSCNCNYLKWIISIRSQENHKIQLVKQQIHLMVTSCLKGGYFPRPGVELAAFETISTSTRCTYQKFKAA